MKGIRGSIVVLLVLGAVALTAPPVGAALETTVVQGRFLRLVSTADWGVAGQLLPDSSVRWDVEISAAAAEPGQIGIGVSASGGAALLIDARLCRRGWQQEDCPGGAETLRSAWPVPRDGSIVPLAGMEATEVARLRLDVRLDPTVPLAGSTEVRVHADGAGDSVDIGSQGGQLPATGSAVPVAAIVIAGVLMAAGAVALLFRGARRRRQGEVDETGAAAPDHASEESRDGGEGL